MNDNQLTAFAPGDRVEVLGVEPERGKVFPLDPKLLKGRVGTVTLIDSLNQVIWIRFEPEDGTNMVVPFDPWDLRKLGDRD